MKIFIDPGHNFPFDSGAVGILKEDEETLKVARELATILIAAGHSVRSTELGSRQITSEGMGLKERCRQSNDWGADLFVSIHFNAFESTPAPMGSEVLAISAAGKRVANQIVTNMGNLGFKNRGVKNGARIMVIEGTNAPAVLGEVCFLDSEADVDLYRRVGVNAVATAIAKGLDLKSIPATPKILPSVGPAAPESTPIQVKPIPVDASTVFYKPGDAINWLNGPGRISKYFIVSEVTQNDPRRIPRRGSPEEAAILKLAVELDKVREAWGKPLAVSSWYRPPAVNKAVGGVQNSRHISGMAVDIAPIDPGEIYEFQRWIDAKWYGALGWGARRGFVHLDTRNGRGFMSGGEKGVRWNY